MNIQSIKILQLSVCLLFFRAETSWFEKGLFMIMISFPMFSDGFLRFSYGFFLTSLWFVGKREGVAKLYNPADPQMPRNLAIEDATDCVAVLFVVASLVELINSLFLLLLLLFKSNPHVSSCLSLAS